MLDWRDINVLPQGPVLLHFNVYSRDLTRYLIENLVLPVKLILLERIHKVSFRSDRSASFWNSFYLRSGSVLFEIYALLKLIKDCCNVHFTNISLVRNLACLSEGKGCDVRANVLQTSELALVYAIAEYCAPVWYRNASSSFQCL